MSGLEVELAQRAPVPLAATFSCAAGELLALVGPSGSGKTTLLRAIAGLVDPVEGRIVVGGETWLDTARGLRLTPQRRRVGLVFQSYALFPHLTALDNVAIAMSGPDARDRALALLHKVRLAGLEGRHPDALSGGQQQRVALARALAREPRVLLLDEPFSAVDQATRQTLYRELAELRRTVSVPIVLVTHDLFEARTLADRMVILDRGETLQAGTPAHLLSRPRNARVAKLLGIQNHFAGVFRTATGVGAEGTLFWGAEGEGVPLRTPDKGRIDDASKVTWVIAGEHLSLQAEDRGGEPPPDGSADYVGCVVEDALPLGEITRCKVRIVAAPADVVIVNVPTRAWRDAGFAVGREAVLRIEREGIHIMPIRSPGVAGKRRPTRGVTATR